MKSTLLGCLVAAAALSARPRRKTSIGTKRKPTTKAPLAAPETFVAATICQAQEPNENFSPLVVPERCRGAAVTRPWFRQVGLDDLFPGAGLGAASDESSDFRAVLRRAAREDCCDENSPVRFDMTCSAQGSWRRPAPATDRVLRETLGASAPTGDEFYAGKAAQRWTASRRVRATSSTSLAAPAVGGWRATRGTRIAEATQTRSPSCSGSPRRAANAAAASSRTSLRFLIS